MICKHTGCNYPAGGCEGLCFSVKSDPPNYDLSKHPIDTSALDVYLAANPSDGKFSFSDPQPTKIQIDVVNPDDEWHGWLLFAVTLVIANAAVLGVIWSASCR